MCPAKSAAKHLQLSVYFSVDPTSNRKCLRLADGIAATVATATADIHRNGTSLWFCSSNAHSHRLHQYVLDRLTRMTQEADAAHREAVRVSTQPQRVEAARVRQHAGMQRLLWEQEAHRVTGPGHEVDGTAIQNLKNGHRIRINSKSHKHKFHTNIVTMH